jgi:hypothetical protein
MGALQTRNWLRTNVGIDTWKALSGSVLLDTFREQGIAIRTQDFFAIRREVLGLKRFEEQIRGLNPETRVPVAWISDAHGLDLGNKFQYRFEVRGTDPVTGDAITSFFALSSSSELSVNVAQEKMLSMLVGSEEFYNLVVKDATLYEVFAKPGTAFR